MIVNKYVIEVVDTHLSHHYLMKYNNKDFVYLDTKNYDAHYDIPLYFYDTEFEANEAISKFNIDRVKYPIIKVSRIEKDVNFSINSTLVH